MPLVRRNRDYYKYGIETNVTVVGSPMIVDGVASGFSASNYLEVTNSFDVSGGKTWEMVYKVTTGSNVTTYQSICGHESTTTNHDPVSIAVTTSSKFALTVCDSSSSGLTEDLAGSHTVTANTTYFVKLFFDGGKYVLSYSLDGVDYTEDVSYISSTSIWTSNLILGRQESSNSSMYPWLGSIDLTQSYIKINGQDWWHGTKAYQVNLGGEDVYGDWEQPVLSANGTMGGDSFAVSASSIYDGNYQPSNVFDEDLTNEWEPVNSSGLPAYIGFYNPKKLKVSKLTITNGNQAYVTKCIFQGSDDYSSWVDIKEIINTVGTLESWSVDVNSTIGYKYHRLYITETSNGSYCDIRVITITAQELVQVGGDDYDYYVNHNKLYTLTRRIREYYKYGTELDANVVGNFARIDRGVASGFSASQYLVHPVAFTPSTQTWEKVFKYITGSTVADGTIYSNGTVDLCGDSLFIYGTKPRLLVGYTASDWNIDSTANYTLLPDTSYWFKIAFNGTSYTVDVSTNGADYENIISVASSTAITANMSQLNIGQRLGYSAPLTSGSIDLSQSYININGERWWSGDSYTKVGSWIDDGVVNGFSSTQYLTLSKAFNPNSNTWEIIVKHTPETLVNNSCIIGQSGADIQSPLLLVNASGQLILYLTSNGSSWNISSNTISTNTIVANTTYFFKLSWDGSQYKVSVSTDGVDFIDYIVVDSTTPIFSSVNPITIGSASSAVRTEFMRGSIDLNQSYIKINGERWWHGTKAVESTEDAYDYYVDSTNLYNLTRKIKEYRKHVINTFDFVKNGTRSSAGWQSVSQGTNYLYGHSNAYEVGQNRYTELLWTYVNTIPATTYTFNITTSGQGNGYISNPTVTITYADGTTEIVYTKDWGGVSLSEDFTFVASKPIKAIKATGTLSHSSVSYVGIDLSLTSLTQLGYQKATAEDYDYYVNKSITY